MLYCPPLKDRVYRSHGSIRDLATQERRGKYKAWDEGRMEKALKAVIGDGYSVRQASEIFNVPKSTLGAQRVDQKNTSPWMKRGNWSSF